MQVQINVQGEKFFKDIKRAGQNRCAGGTFSGKSIIVQVGFFLYSIMLSHYPVLERLDTVSEHSILFQNFLSCFRTFYSVIELPILV